MEVKDFVFENGPFLVLHYLRKLLVHFTEDGVRTDFNIDEVKRSSMAMIVVFSKILGR